MQQFRDAVLSQTGNAIPGATVTVTRASGGLPTLYLGNGTSPLISNVLSTDENGEYKYPEGFDAETGAWKEGFDAQREAWEQEYAAAQTRWEAHKVQVARMNAEADALPEIAPVVEASSAPAEESAGTLAEDEQLAALRDKLAGKDDE